MTNPHERAERFSGHESFICRYGWLPKVFRAVVSNPRVLRDEELAMTTLGIGRNMVKSLQFWAEATGVIIVDGTGMHVPGSVGSRLFAESGWDPYLESLESLWLIHWQLSTNAGLAAWNEVFGEGKLIRFDRQKLINALSQRGAKLARPLAPSTLEQHTSIFIQSYYQAERGTDDTSWCPLQDLGLIKATKTEDGRVLYNTDLATPVGLSLRVFGLALIDFLARQDHSWTADFKSVLKGNYSPGIVFRLDEHQLRQLIESATAGPFHGALRFVDTADTQSIVLTPTTLDPQYHSWAQEEVLEHA
ncbi:MAG: DUF4007 family protein [Gammaproteobacteria bacterium]|nr:DUF4007 family protein [Gammaproteobacteria bacterium]MBU1409794.1 DUF4007 family protein [Gammaproteobacteria bacterium]